MVSQNEVLTKDQANIAGYRQNRGYQADVLVYGDVTISFSAMEVRRGGQLVALTRKEFKTLAYFLKNARRVISRDELLNEVWGYEFYPSHGRQPHSAAAQETGARTGPPQTLSNGAGYGI